jgi:hypothetical protein
MYAAYRAQALGIVEGPDGMMQSIRGDIPPNVEWVAQFLLVYQATPQSTSMDSRVSALNVSGT